MCYNKFVYIAHLPHSLESAIIIQKRQLDSGGGLVHCGASRCKFCLRRREAVEFRTLFPILKKYLADGDDVPAFFRELMATITTVTEEEWGTSKDPSARLSDETIRSYTKRKLPKKLASSIVYRLTPDRLTKRIKGLKKAARGLLAADLNPYDAAITAENVGEKVTALLVEIIQRSAGLAPKNELALQQQTQLASDLKARYGDYLFGETNGYCPFPGCGRELELSADGRVQRVYEVSLIDKSGKAEPDNLLAVCPRCCAIYRLDSDKKLTKELLEIKKLLSSQRQSARFLDDLPLEKGIIRVIGRIGRLGEQDLEGASLDPSEIRRKLNPAKDAAVYILVNGYVSAYFVKIREIMTNLDRRGEIHYDEIQDQIHAMYRRLKRAGKSPLEIFNGIVGKIHRVTLQDEVFCQIVVSYFVQSCEVFDAITE